MAAQGLAVQSLTELQQFELRQPVALLKGRQRRVAMARGHRRRGMESWWRLVIPGRQQPPQTGPEKGHGAENEAP